MKNLGEVMGIERSFREALHKATQSLEIKETDWVQMKRICGLHAIIEKLTHASWDRVFVIYDAIAMGIPLSQIYDITKIDMWYLKQYEELFQLEKVISTYTIKTINKELLLEAKQKGYGDRQIAHMLGCLESQVYNKREAMNIQRVYKLVDTCAAEFEAQTPYYYSTFESTIQTKDGLTTVANESVVSDKKKLLYWDLDPIELDRIELIIAVFMVFWLLSVGMKPL